jgi:hypothetical protein
MSHIGVKCFGICENIRIPNMFLFHDSSFELLIFKIICRPESKTFSVTRFARMNPATLSDKQIERLYDKLKTTAEIRK